MHSKRQLLKRAKLYLILDREVNSYEELFGIAQKAISAGVDIIQLRDKKGSAGEIGEFSKAMMPFVKDRVLYIINDRVDCAMKDQVHGVHLGQNDTSVADARTTLGQDAIIGVSCQTLEHALKAVKDGADYIGFGSIYKTQTKPDRNPMDLDVLEEVVQLVSIPLFAIGGINFDNITELKGVGVSRIALCRAICQENDIEQTVRQFRASLDETIVYDEALRGQFN